MWWELRNWSVHIGKENAACCLTFPESPSLGGEQHCIKNTDFVAGLMRGLGTKPLEKFKVEQRQEIRSQATERTQLQDPIEEWTETNALSLKNA